MLVVTTLWMSDRTVVVAVDCVLSLFAGVDFIVLALVDVTEVVGNRVGVRVVFAVTIVVVVVVCVVSVVVLGGVVVVVVPPAPVVETVSPCLRSFVVGTAVGDLHRGRFLAKCDVLL